MCHNGRYIYIYIYIYVVIFSLCRLVHKVKSLRVVWLWSLSRQTGRGGAYAGTAEWCKGVAQWLPWFRNLQMSVRETEMFVRSQCTLTYKMNTIIFFFFKHSFTKNICISLTNKAFSLLLVWEHLLHQNLIQHVGHISHH